VTALCRADAAGVSLPVVSKLEVEVMEDMGAPIHIYYVLNSFYQNHKRFVRSVSHDQLHGNDVSYGALTECVPQRVLDAEANETLLDDGTINPCGLTAWSYFNDTFMDFQVRSAGGVHCRNRAGPDMSSVNLVASMYALHDGALAYDCLGSHAC
jgi:hypothetical protein